MALPTRTTDLNSMPKTHMVEGKKQPMESCPLASTYILGHEYTAPPK